MLCQCQCSDSVYSLSSGCVTVCVCGCTHSMSEPDYGSLWDSVDISYTKSLFHKQSHSEGRAVVCGLVFAEKRRQHVV